MCSYDYQYVFLPLCLFTSTGMCFYQYVCSLPVRVCCMFVLYLREERTVKISALQMVNTQNFAPHSSPVMNLCHNFDILYRAGGTGGSGQANARPIVWRRFVLFIYLLLPRPQNNKIHTAHVGG